MIINKNVRERGEGRGERGEERGERREERGERREERGERRGDGRGGDRLRIRYGE